MRSEPEEIVDFIVRRLPAFHAPFVIRIECTWCEYVTPRVYAERHEAEMAFSQHWHAKCGRR